MPGFFLPVFSPCKIYLVKQQSLLIFLLFQIFFRTLSAGQTPGGDEFSPKTIWFNCETELTMSLFKEKILVIEIWHPDCLEGRGYAQRIQEMSDYNQQIQLVSLIPGDTANPFSRSDITFFIQKNQLHHPVGICPDFAGFLDLKADRFPILMLYQQSSKPVMVSNDGASLEEVMFTLTELVKDKAYIYAMNPWQAGPAVDPKYYADPLIEAPEYIASSEGAFPLYITESSHQRIIELDESGTTTQTIGSSRGYIEGNFLSARFFNPGGVSFDPLENLLYIADTDNNRVRIADMQSKIVYSLLGDGGLMRGKPKTIDGPLESIGYPTDVVYHNKKLYVLSGQTNQLFVADPVSGKAELLVDLEEQWTRTKCRVYAKNLSISKEGFFIVMSNGDAYEFENKKLKKLQGEMSALIQDGKRTFLLEGAKGKIDVLKKNNLTTLATCDSSQLVNWKKSTDMTKIGGELYVCDYRHHRIRQVDILSGKVSTFQIQPAMELVYNIDAIAGGEPVIYDSLRVKSGQNQLHLTIDIPGYVLVKKGRNEINVNDQEGPQLSTNQITSEGVDVKFDVGKLPSPLLQFEIYLTASPINEPDIIFIKRTFFNVMLQEDPEGERKHEITYQPTMQQY